MLGKPDEVKTTFGQAPIGNAPEKRPHELQPPTPNTLFTDIFRQTHRLTLSPTPPLIAHLSP